MVSQDACCRCRAITCCFTGGDYLRTEPFKLRGVDGNYASVPESVYFEAKDDLDWLIVPRNGRLQVIDLGQSEK